MSIEAIVKEFSAVAANPKGQLKAYKDAGKKCIGVMPYYAPEELVYAAGMMPFGMWGSNSKTIQRAKEYCATFYCTIAQLDLEMLLDGTMDLLDGVITPTICDTLRPMSQNIRVAMSEKLPCIFLAHPQNRFADWGKQFCMDQYDHVKGELEKIANDRSYQPLRLAHQLNVDLRFSTRDDLAQADLQTTLNGLLARINALSDSIRQTYLEAL